MRLHVSTLVLYLAVHVTAYPSLHSYGSASSMRQAVAKRQSATPQGVGAPPLVPPPFDSSVQFVETTGEHEVYSIVGQ